MLRPSIFSQGFLKIAASVSLCFLASCASVSVKKAAVLSDHPPRQVPAKIFVAPFAFYENGVRVDRSGEDLATFKLDLQRRMTTELVEKLQKHVAPAEAAVAAVHIPPGNAWLVTGRFQKINQGSRLLRGVVGLGSGGTKMEAEVIVYSLVNGTPRPFLQIQTTGGSNITPGIGGIATYTISGVMALPSVFNIVEGARTGVSYDADRTAREITAAISQYLFRQGAIPYEKSLAPKRLGEVRKTRAPERNWSGRVSVYETDPSTQ